MNYEHVISKIRLSANQEYSDILAWALLAAFAFCLCWLFYSGRNHES